MGFNLFWFVFGDSCWFWGLYLYVLVGGVVIGDGSCYDVILWEGLWWVCYLEFNFLLILGGEEVEWEFDNLKFLGYIWLVFLSYFVNVI